MKVQRKFFEEILFRMFREITPKVFALRPHSFVTLITSLSHFSVQQAGPIA